MKLADVITLLAGGPGSGRKPEGAAPQLKKASEHGYVLQNKDGSSPRHYEHKSGSHFLQIYPNGSWTHGTRLGPGNTAYTQGTDKLGMRQHLQELHG